MATVDSSVELGFLEKTDDWRLLSHFFPHKVGGKPAWLSLNGLPSVDDIQCGNCGKICCFLAQLYCPIADKPTCFHRALFVFVCKDPGCSKRGDNKNFVVLRCQLSRVNEFYAHEPPKEDTFDESSDYPRAEKYQSMCIVCGLTGPKRCSRCQKASYCSKEHQTIDWKSGHKKACSEPDYSGSASCSFTFPEYEIITEPEEWDEEPSKTEEVKMAEYEELLKSGKISNDLKSPVDSKDLDHMSSGVTEDKQFNKFKKRVDLDPDQVVRYNRSGEPLWVSAENIPFPKDIPDCTCGAKREFEFQIMPHLLSYLEVDSLGDSIDWGTLVVYSCAKSCDEGNSYRKEFIWKQDFSLDKES